MLHLDNQSLNTQGDDSSRKAIEDEAPLLPKNRLVKTRVRKRKNKLILPVSLSNPLSQAPNDIFDIFRETTPEPLVTPLHAKENVRTINMKKFLHELSADYSEGNNIITINDKDYQIISSAVTQFAGARYPLVSIGSSSHREIIVLDQSESPLLQKCYEQYRRVLRWRYNSKTDGKLDAKELIDLTNDFMQKHVFKAYGNLVEKVEKLVMSCLNNPDINKIRMRHQSGQVPCIPIDIFIQAGTGVCRHHALVSAYLMDRFIHHHPKRCGFVGEVQIMRDNIDDGYTIGAHAWVTLICKEGDQNKTYSLDSLNNLVGHLDDTEFVRLFNRAFGHRTTSNQLKKAEAVRERSPQLK